MQQTGQEDSSKTKDNQSIEQLRAKTNTILTNASDTQVNSLTRLNYEFLDMPCQKTFKYTDDILCNHKKHSHTSMKYSN